MRLVWPMLQPYRRWRTGPVSTALLAPLAVLAYTGLLFAPGMLLYPVLIAYSVRARPAAIVLALVLTLGLLALLFRRVANNARDLRSATDSVSVDHVTCMIGCMLWSATAVYCAVVALDVRTATPHP